MASHPTSSCCLEANLHTGETKGKDIKIENGTIDAYLATPPVATVVKGGILFLTDVFGIWENPKLVADAFAEHGYLTLIPDLFQGDAVPVKKPDNFDVRAWIEHGSDGKTPHTGEAQEPFAQAGIKVLKDMGAAKIAAVGYCLGAKPLIRSFKHGIDVGFVAHPSFVTAEELGAITGPLSIASAQVDGIFPQDKRVESEDILVKTGQPFQINVFSGVQHGFGIRADLSDPTAKWAKEQAFAQAVSWFDFHLSK